MDIFKRTPFEISDDLLIFKKALTRDADEVSIAHGAEPYSPGLDIKTFYKCKPKRHPESDTEKAVFQALLDAPLPMEYISNFLIYSKSLRRSTAREKKALWSLVRGGGVKALRTYVPNNYWLLANS